MTRPYAYTSTHRNSQFYYPINRWVDIVKYPGKLKPTRGQSIIIFTLLLALVFVMLLYIFPLIPSQLGIKQFLIDHFTLIIFDLFVLYCFFNQE